MMKWILMAIGGLVALGAMTAAVGFVLPKGHKASRTVTYAATPAAVFGAITNVRRYMEWRSDVKQVEVLPDDGKGLNPEP